MLRLFLLAGLAMLLIFGCETPSSPIIGLWEITEVRAGAESMTPNARWARFFPDGTQESGNGWLKHSEGTYDYQPETNRLSMEATTGVADEFGDFACKFTSQKQMIWSREEEDMTIHVTLKRIDNLPPGYTDQARGLWKLTEAEGGTPEISAEPNAHLFLRWDGRFFDYQSSKAGGVYNVHAHKPEIEFIPYDAALPRSWWRFSREGNKLTIERLNSEEKITRTYVQTDRFLD